MGSRFKKIGIFATIAALSLCLVGCTSGTGTAGAGKEEAQEAMNVLEPYLEHLNERLYENDKIALSQEAYDDKQNKTVKVLGKDGWVVWHDQEEAYWNLEGEKQVKATRNWIYGISWGDNTLSLESDYKYFADTFKLVLGADCREEESNGNNVVFYRTIWPSYQLKTDGGFYECEVTIEFEKPYSSDEGDITISFVAD